MKKTIRRIVITLLVLALALPLSFIAGCQESDNNEYASAYMIMSINPEIEFVVDENGNIESVYAVNEDAEILLAELDIVGMNIEEATELIVDMATQLGFIDVDGEDNEVSIAIITDDEDENAQEIKERMQNRIRERVHNFFDNNGIFGRVSQDTLDEYQEQALELGVSMGKTKMILRALEIDPTLDINELKDMPMNELAKGLSKGARENFVNAEIREEYKGERQQILEEYPQIAEIRQQIAQLEESLDNFEGDEEDRAEIEEELITKKQELEEVIDQAREDIQELNSEYQEHRQQIAQQKRQAAQERVQQNRERIENHKDKISEKRAEQIREWRKNR